MAWALPICEKALPLRDVAPKAIRLCEARRSVVKARVSMNAESLGESDRTPYESQRGRRVREDVRVKEEWLNPGGRQLRACREANIKLWRR